MAKNKINLQIITPTRKVLDEVIDSVILRTQEGEMAVLYDHEPVVTLLAHAPLAYRQEDGVKKATVMGGFAEVTEDKVVILTDASELLEEIDIDRARAAHERATKRLSKNDIDVKRAEIALRKALIRIKLVEDNK